MKRNEWILQVLAAQPEPPREVCMRDNYWRNFCTLGNFTLLFIGLLFLSGGIVGFSNNYSSGEAIAFGIFLVIGILLLLLSLLAPIASINLVKKGQIREAIIEDVTFQAGSDATIEAVNNGGIAVGVLRVVKLGSGECASSEFECDDPWACKISKGSRVLVLTHWKTGVVCELLGLKEEMQLYKS
jgi:hypothetical protein